VALVILLVLIYSTIGQMRPTSVVWAIHDRTLAARREEENLVTRTRRTSSSPHNVAAVFRSATTGYLTHVDLGRLEQAVHDTEDVEICLHVTTGDRICYGDTVASVRDGDVNRAETIAAKVAAALTISRQRDLSHDPTTGIDELGNIAWTSGSTAKQNPEVARESLFALEDMAVRWLADDPAGSSASLLPVIYHDNDADRLLDVLYSLVVAAQESHQHMFAAAVLDTYTHLLTRAPESVGARLRDDFASIEELLDQMPPSPPLGAARRSVDDTLQQALSRARGNGHFRAQLGSAPRPRTG
jgi:Predicted membrane protein (DUF2254)